MKKLAMIAGAAGFMMLGSVNVADAQMPGTPSSAFPDAAPHEVQVIDGVPCRTVLDHASNRRIPIQCAAPGGMVGMDVTTTGSILVGPPAGAPVSGTPGSAFPDASPNEIRVYNGVPCRTVLVHGTNQRVPVECAR